MRLRAKFERALAHMTDQLPENWGGEGERGSFKFQGLQVASSNVVGVVGASPGSSSASVWQHDQEEHHVEEAVHPNLEYEQGAFLGASELERADSLSLLPDREILAPADRELVVLLETDQLTATAGRGDSGELKEMAGEGGEHIVEHGTVVGSLTKQAEERVYRSGVWTLKESTVLLEAKKREKEILTGSKRNAVSADEKWRATAEYCWSRGVQRSKEQCRFKWENTLPDFKKVRDYEDEKGANNKSYFEMESWQRKQLNLPPNLNRELYGIMDKLLMRKQGPGTAGGTKKESKGKELVAQPDETAVVLNTAVPALPTKENFPIEILQRDTSIIPKGITDLVGTKALSQGGEMVGERSSSGVQSTFRVHKDTPTPEVKGSARKRRKKITETQQEAVGRAFGTAPVELRTSVEIGSASTHVPAGFRDSGNTASDTGKEADVWGSASVLVSEVPPSQAPGIQSVRLRASHELLPFKQMGQKQHQGTSEAGDTSRPAERKGHKKMGAAPSTEQRAEINTTTVAAEKSSADYLMRTEETKEARHQETLALEREKLTANKEAMNMIAMALNNVADAFLKIADLLQRS